MKSMSVFQRFVQARRSAIAVTMAIALVPLVLLIGIAVDVTFLSQDRLQTAFAAEGAAASATRVAAATYVQEVANNVPAPKNETSQNAALQSINSGNVVGNLWFDANLGNYSIGSLNSRTTTTTYDGNITGNQNNAVPPNFTAQVTTSSSYPPIFNPLFGHATSQQWVFSTGGSATTQFAYAQILMMLDTSNSMLIGARQQDIKFMELNTVCMPPAQWPNNSGFYPLLLKNAYGVPAGNDFYDFAPGVDNTWIGFTSSDPSPPTYYQATNHGVEPPSTATAYPSGTAPYQLDGTCSNGAQPYIPCALACHNSTQTVTYNGKTVPQDLYGFARANNVELRVDVVLSATEKVIQDMETSEAVANQLSIGVYQFNADISTIARGNTANGDALPEATNNLPSALSAVQAVDYNYNASETSIPVFINGCSTSYNFAANMENCFGNTNLVLSMRHLVNGALPLDSGAKALTAAGKGDSATTPLKFMFVVTDGMEGESQYDGATDLPSNLAFAKGAMTSLADNQAVTNSALTPGTCTAIKKLGYTVYVLYIDYLPVSETQYYQAMNVTLPQTQADFPNQSTTFQQMTDAEPDIAQGGSSSQITQRIASNVPTAEALAQCASSPSDFYSANSDTDIQTALNAMLKAALASTIRLTN